MTGQGRNAATAGWCGPQPGTGEARYTLGRFHSVWRRDAAGVWRVLYDDGIDLGPATPAQVEAFHAARREACPARTADRP